MMNDRAPPEWDRLLRACQKNDSYLAFKLIYEEGVSPSHANRFGQSALHIAALWAHGKTLSTAQFVFVFGIKQCHPTTDDWRVFDNVLINTLV